MTVCVNGHDNEDNFKFCKECGTAVNSETVDLGRALHLTLNLEPPIHSRGSVFFRFFLALILQIISMFIGIGVYFAVIGAWFGALFTGKVPEGIHKFVSRWLDYQTRISAYSNLLTARHPGYSMTPKADCELTTRVANGPMNRLAVFFRILLAFPAALLSVVGVFGMQLLVIVMWFSALFTTKTPRVLHQAVAALLRYQARYSAYYFLLSPEQPWHGLYGDVKQASDEALSTSATSSVPQWCLTKGARRTITIAIILGVFSYIGFVILLGGLAANVAQYEYFCMDSMGNITSTISVFPMNCDSGSLLYQTPIR